MSSTRADISSKKALSIAPTKLRPTIPLRPRWKSVTLVSMLIAPLLITPVVQANDIEGVFEKSCAGCHAGGGNVLGGRTLRIEDLQAMQLVDSESLFTIIYGGNKRMPGFGQNCEPRGQCTFGPRLTDDEVRSLAEYVLDRAQKGWD